MRRTKLVCTIGPASRERIGELVEAGMDVARLNFSHGTPELHRDALQHVREAADRVGRALAVVADLPGPKVRVAELARSEIELEPDDELTLLPPGDPLGREGSATVTYGGLAADVRAGDRLMLADGAVELRVRETDGRAIRADVVRGGLVRPGAGLNVPSERLSLPGVTERDRSLLGPLLEMGADYVAQSFVRRAADVDELRSLMGRMARPIVAKIETRAAINHLDEILATADAVMLARGDLGVELPFAEVPVIQKRVIEACAAAGVPVIVATQMLESMVSAPRPTRAEASDVANAVLDGSDAVMLSAETAIGTYPIEAARAAVAICVAAEGAGAADRPAGWAEVGSEAGAIAAAAVDLARRATDPAVRAIACFTRSGLTAQLLSSQRPGCPVYALAPDEPVVRRLALWRSVVPLHASAPRDTDEMIRLADENLQAAGLETGARVVIVGSTPFGRARTNFIKLHRIGSA